MSLNWQSMKKIKKKYIKIVIKIYVDRIGNKDFPSIVWQKMWYIKWWQNLRTNWGVVLEKFFVIQMWTILGMSKMKKNLKISWKKKRRWILRFDLNSYNHQWNLYKTRRTTMRYFIRKVFDKFPGYTSLTCNFLR